MTKPYQPTTRHGYSLSEAASAFQKAVRRGDERLAGYFGIEMVESKCGAYFWRRVLVISAEDIFRGLTAEMLALQSAWEAAQKKQKGTGRIFCAKAIVLLCRAEKSRDSDHLTNLLYDADAIPKSELDAAIKAVEGAEPDGKEPVPDYAFDVHTARGRKAGKTKADFFRDENAALRPRAPGLFDWLV